MLHYEKIIIVINFDANQFVADYSSLFRKYLFTLTENGYFIK